MQEKPQSFSEGQPKVPMKTNADLDVQISSDVLYAELQSQEGGKAPVIEGLLTNFKRFSGL